MTRKNDPQRGGIGGHLTQMRPRDRCGVIRNKTPGLEIHDMRLRFGNAETIDCTRDDLLPHNGGDGRSEEHTSELQSLMRISYAVFCLKKKKQLALI